MSRRGKLSHCDAKARLEQMGVDFSEDFHALRASDVDSIALVAKMAGYRKRRDAPGSTARMYFYFLGRQRRC